MERLSANTENIYITETSVSRIFSNKLTGGRRINKWIAWLKTTRHYAMGKSKGIAAAFHTTKVEEKNSSPDETLYNGLDRELKAQREFQREFKREMTKISVGINNWI